MLQKNLILNIYSTLSRMSFQSSPVQFKRLLSRARNVFFLLNSGYLPMTLTLLIAVTLATLLKGEQGGSGWQGSLLPCPKSLRLITGLRNNWIQ